MDYAEFGEGYLYTGQNDGRAAVVAEGECSSRLLGDTYPVGRQRPGRKNADDLIGCQSLLEDVDRALRRGSFGGPAEREAIMRAFQQQAASDAARGVSGAGEQAALDQLNRRLDDFFSPFKRGYYVRFAQDNASGLRRLEIVSLRGNVRDTLDYVIPE